MNDVITSRSDKNDELLLLHMIERFNLIMLSLLTAGSWYFVDWPFAQSVLLGAALASGSFFWMKRAALRFIQHTAALGDEQRRSTSSSFAIKFYARFSVLALLLLLLNTRFSINAIGLVIGLSTIMLSIIIVVLFQGRIIFQENT